MEWVFATILFFAGANVIMNIAILVFLFEIYKIL